MNLYSVKMEDKGDVVIWTVWESGSRSMGAASKWLDWFPTEESALGSIRARQLHDMALG